MGRSQKRGEEERTEDIWNFHTSDFEDLGHSLYGALYVLGFESHEGIIMLLTGSWRTSLNVKQSEIGHLTTRPPNAGGILP